MRLSSLLPMYIPIKAQAQQSTPFKSPVLPSLQADQVQLRFGGTPPGDGWKAIYGTRKEEEANKLQDASGNKFKFKKIRESEKNKFKFDMLIQQASKSGLERNYTIRQGNVTPKKKNGYEIISLNCNDPGIPTCSIEVARTAVKNTSQGYTHWRLVPNNATSVTSSPAATEQRQVAALPEKRKTPPLTTQTPETRVSEIQSEAQNPLWLLVSAATEPHKPQRQG